MATDKGILLTKSPYFINETGSTGFTSTLEIRIWNGAFSGAPSGATHTIVKQSLSNDSTSTVIEIAKIVEDSFTHLSDIYDLAGSAKTDSLWVNVQTFGGDVNRDDTWLGLDGYSYFLDGINFDFTGSVFISERILYHYTDIPLTLPVKTDGSGTTTTVVYRLADSTVDTIDLSGFTGSTNSYDKLQYVELTGHTAGTIDNIQIKNNDGTVIDTLTVNAGRCTKYDTYVVSFINRFGVNQELVFSLANNQSVNIDSESFNRQNMNIIGGVIGYSTGRHQIKQYNTNRFESITLNIDYIDESLNDTLAQLISSENIWITVDGIKSPVNAGTKTLNYKTRVNDGLVSYSITFDYAFNKINNIY